MSTPHRRPAHDPPTIGSYLHRMQDPAGNLNRALWLQQMRGASTVIEVGSDSERFRRLVETVLRTPVRSADDLSEAQRDTVDVVYLHDDVAVTVPVLIEWWDRLVPDGWLCGSGFDFEPPGRRALAVIEFAEMHSVDIHSVALSPSSDWAVRRSGRAAVS